MIYSVSVTLYEELKSRLMDAVGDRPYFSGSISFAYEQMSCRLVVSCFVRHKVLEAPEGRFLQVTDCVPVWWEFHTEEGAVELLNDFSFNTLRELF
ncbi:MAG: hypothetical protein E7149_04685 [Rikenellaceae bacterium]|nr:hypothetical protein [Rikenellaceae bacterium]